jgi:hypothetical protein
MLALKTHYILTPTKALKEYNFLYGIVTVEGFSAICGQLKHKYKKKNLEKCISEAFYL